MIDASSPGFVPAGCPPQEAIRATKAGWDKVPRLLKGKSIREVMVMMVFFVEQEPLIASLLLVAMPGAPSSDALAPSSFLFLVESFHCTLDPHHPDKQILSESVKRCSRGKGMVWRFHHLSTCGCLRPLAASAMVSPWFVPAQGFQELSRNGTKPQREN